MDSSFDPGKLKDILTCGNSPHVFGHVSMTDAAVLVPFVEIDGEWNLLFMHRTSEVEKHKDQVSFPGGAMDPGDENLIMTALRETREETGIAENHIEVLGCLPKMDTTTGFNVLPVVGIIREYSPLQVNNHEVKRIFTVPFKWLRESNHRQLKPYHRSDGSTVNVMVFDEYDGETIWGVTASIIHSLLNVIL